MAAKKILIEIHRSKTMKKKFIVQYYGKNGEIISSSELLDSVLNCEINIIAHLNIFDPKKRYKGVWVMDFTRVKKGEKRKAAHEKTKKTIK